MNRGWGKNQVLNESPPLPADEYGYEECEPSPRPESPRLLYGMEWKPAMNVLVKGDHAPLPADRLARKQRIVGRRGGVGQLQLMQNAAMAALEMNHESDDDISNGFRRDNESLSAFYPAQPMSRERTSPRKRARRASTHSTEPDSAVAATGKLFENLSTHDDDDKDEDDPVRGLVRRTSRRTSYDSKIKGTNDDFLLLSAYATNASQARYK